MPQPFNPADPGAYSAGNWRIWDAIVVAAHKYGMRVDLDLMGGAPRWAIGPGPWRAAGGSRTAALMPA